MTIYYLRSTDGNDSDNGSTWALAKATLVGALTVAVAGDTIYVSQVHAETQATQMDLVCAGTTASPVRIICANDGAAPPTAVATTATITTTTNGSIVFTGSAYIYGITFSYGDGGSGNPVFYVNVAVGGHWLRFERCKITSLNTAGGAPLGIYAGVDENVQLSRLEFRNTDVSFPTTTGHGVSVAHHQFYWDGGSVIAGSLTPAALISAMASWRGNQVLIENVDLSVFDATVNIFLNSAYTAEKAIIRNCKLPASWSGALGSGTSLGSRYEMYNCDSGATNYKMRIDDWSGRIDHEATIVRTGGATDGTTPLAWKMVSNTNVAYPQMTLDSPSIAIWNDTTGSSVTATIYGIWGGGAVPLNDEIWMEVSYPSASGTPLGATNAADTKADILATAANQDTDGSTWGGSTTAFKLGTSFTPQMKGPLHVVVKVAKASSTFYIDPKIVLS